MRQVYVLSLASLQGSSFDTFPPGQDGSLPAEKHIGGRDVLQRLMIPPVMVLLHEVGDRAFYRPRRVVVLEFHHVLQRAMVPFDLPLGHRMVGRAPRVWQPVRVQIRRELLGEVARAVVTEQARSMDDPDSHQQSIELDYCLELHRPHGSFAEEVSMIGHCWLSRASVGSRITRKVQEP